MICKQGNPTAKQTSKLAQRVATELKAAGWRLEQMLSDNGNEFRGHDFTSILAKLSTRHSRIHASRPQTNGNVEAWRLPSLIPSHEARRSLRLTCPALPRSARQ